MEIKGLDSLPQFRIDSIESNGKDYMIIGSFNHVSGIRNDTGWLYNIASWKDSGSVTIISLKDISSKSVKLSLYDSEYISIFQPGKAFPYIDGYWQPMDVAIILDELSTWNKVHFKPTDAEYFRLNGAIGWQETGKKLPVGAQFMELKKDGWDHEHCRLCWENISLQTQPFGYRNNDNIWVCESCYTKYVLTHNLDFLY
ncbi:MAG: hypothetical protein P4L45_17065 [Ignavibacteriaceae bacterium]|nr:hypothetical protein [Ignavibacteriaceae bacterium]